MIATSLRTPTKRPWWWSSGRRSWRRCTWPRTSVRERYCGGGGAQLMTARRLSGWASPEYEWREATSDASDYRGGGGGRVATCDGSVDHLVGWCTRRSQCCLYGPVRARLVSVYWDGSRPGLQPATLGSWCASAVGNPSKPPTLQARWTWPPSPWRRHPCKPQHAWRPLPGALLPEGTIGLTTGWRFGGRLEWLGPTACRSVTPTSGLSHGASVEAVSYGAAPASWPPPQPPYAPGASFSGAAVLFLNVFKQFNTDWARSCVRRAVWLTKSSSIPSAWASWKEVYERPSSRCADPRLVVTHRFSWAQWCKGWKTLPSYRLEGPVSSNPLPVGQWFPHKTWASAAFTAVRWMPLNLGGRWANWIA